MSKIYFYQTIEECEKEIRDKSMIVDINHASNLNLLESFIRMVRTIIIWANIICFSVTFHNNGFKSSIKVFGMFLVVHIVYAILMSWVKYNYNEYYIKMKVKLIDRILEDCKEWQENEYQEWQQKQMLKRFGILAYLEK